jgi:formylglycine-generating enzyme required for sulfatase activity
VLCDLDAVNFVVAFGFAYNVVFEPDVDKLIAAEVGGEVAEVLLLAVGVVAHNIVVQPGVLHIAHLFHHVPHDDQRFVGKDGFDIIEPLERESGFIVLHEADQKVLFLQRAKAGGLVHDIADGNILPDAELSLQMTIRTGGPDGAVVYQETHEVTTNAFGLVNLVIGSGTPQSGSFGAIEWGKNSHYLETAIDINGSKQFQVMGVTQFLSVPYAQFSGYTGSVLTMTTQERNALADPPVGMQIYNVTTNCLNYYNGAEWFETCGTPVVNLPPEVPSNPFPVNNALDMPLNITFTWDCSDPEMDPLTYDLYIDNDGTPDLYASGITSNSFDIINLDPSTTYQWKIVAHDNHGNSTEGPVWNFTTESTLPPGVELVQITGGTFALGSPVVNTTISSFKMSKHEITNEQFIYFLNHINCPANGTYNDPTHGSVELIDMDDPDCAIGHSGSAFYFKGSTYAPTSNCPVIEVTWYGANRYCRWAGGRLPTEAEWEVAARGATLAQAGGTYNHQWAGTNTESQLTNYAWYNVNSSGKTHPVGTKTANELGLRDMSGNVWEWCNDWIGSTFPSGSNNPTGPATGSYRVFRGGSGSFNAYICEVANRGNDYPGISDFSIGFRLVVPQ